MRRILCAILLLVPACAWCQSATISIKGKNQIDWTIILRPKTVISAWTCDQTEMEPGDTANCTATISQPARFGGYVMTLIVPSGFSGPATVTVPAGATTASVQVTRIDTTASVRPRILPAAWAIAGPGMPTLRYASVLIPCCARADGCGLPPGKISQLPCQR